MKNSKELRTFKRRMKSKPTYSERLFKEKLEAAKIPFKTQLILGFYILDFVLPDKMICFEIDGESHDTKKEYDERRDYFTETLGFRVFRIKNKEVSNYSIEWVLKQPSFREYVFRRALSRANVERGRVIDNVRIRKKFRPITLDKLMTDKNARLFFN